MNITELGIESVCYYCTVLKRGTYLKIVVLISVFQIGTYSLSYIKHSDHSKERTILQYNLVHVIISKSDLLMTTYLTKQY